MITLITKHPIATESPDHIAPLGTRQDNSVNLAFNRKLRELIPPPLRVLDLGCAGGGMVASFLDEGDFAVGVDGSDYSKARSRAAWGEIPGNLFTADITEPFAILRDFVPMWFDAVTMWEVFEHIAEDKLLAVLENIRAHLESGGLIIASISTAPDHYQGHAMHQTVRPRTWWLTFLDAAGWTNHPDLVAHFGADMVRGEPSSFHVVLTRKDEG